MPGNAHRPINARWSPQRLSALYVIFFVLAAGVLARLVNLEVIEGNYYARLSENNFLVMRKIDAPRGPILDRNGNELAYNRSTFEVSMSPGNLTTAAIRASLDRLGELIGRDLSTYYRSVVRLRPRWKSRVVSRRLTLDQVTAVLEQRYDLPGVAVEQRFQRYYPHGSTLCHILGRVGKITKAMWNRKDRRYQRAGYDMDDDVGITGVEAAFESVLRGQKGLEQVWKTGRGRLLSARILQPALPGEKLYLTIDLGLQQLAEHLLLGLKGVILVMDPRTGEMLAWASSPGYDLNRPAAIENPADKPKINRAIQEYYPPGSAFKVITAIAGLEAGWPADRRVTCEHFYYLPHWRRPFKCLGWHGPLDLVGALKYSCNIYFYNIAYYLYTLDPRDAGYRLVRTARRYGFEDFTGVGSLEPMEPAPGFLEKPGRLPLLRDLRAERGSLLHLAIGQGRIDVTPLQMLVAYAALANGGELLVPRVVREVRTNTGELVFGSQKVVRRNTGLDPEYRRLIVQGLLDAVYERGGTAHGAGFAPEWRVAGKTSTSQRQADAEPDAWFIGFAPAENPELVVLVLVENGGHGGKVAAPLAAKIFERYFSRSPQPATIASQ